MEQILISPIFSFFASIFLIAGTFQLGKNIIYYLNLKKIIETVSFLEFQYISTGVVFLLIILFPLVAFTNYATLILKGFAFFLLFLYFKFFIEIRHLIKKIKFNFNDFYFIFFLLLVFLYFLLSLSPLTAADVLDYHSGVALNILRFNQYTIFPEWFTSLQSGSGEVLIALGFSLGAEQFGSLVQFASILSISGIIIKISKKNSNFSSDYFTVLTILTCPILIFLLSGNKPQIFYSSILFFAFSLNFVKFKKQDYYKIYLIINLLVCICVIGKFSFNLTGFLVWTFSTIKFINKQNYSKIILIPIFVFIFIYFPYIYWKYSILGGNLFNYIISPFPLHLPGYETFLNHNKGSQEIPFPNFLFYTTLSRYTEFLAANTFLIFILIFKYKENKNIIYILALSISFVVISNIYASPSARYYLDVILWITLGILLIKKINYFKILQFIFFPQIFVTLIILLYSNYNFLPANFSKANYIDMKNKFAYMYSGFDWLNNSIPKNSNVLILNRPLALYKDFAISGNFNYFTNKTQSTYYKKIIQDYKIDYLAYFGPNPDLKHLKNCVSKLFKKKEKVGFHATRNPFNRGSYYNGYIYHFDSSKLPNC